MDREQTGGSRFSCLFPSWGLYCSTSYVFRRWAVLVTFSIPKCLLLCTCISKTQSSFVNIVLTAALPILQLVSLIFKGAWDFPSVDVISLQLSFVLSQDWFATAIPIKDQPEWLHHACWHHYYRTSVPMAVYLGQFYYQLKNHFPLSLLLFTSWTASSFPQTYFLASHQLE